MSSAPTINYRLEGGFNLSWGSHGYEQYGIYYGLNVDNGSTYLFYSNTGNLLLNDYGTQHSLHVASVYQAWNGNLYSGTYTTTNIGTTAPKTPIFGTQNVAQTQLDAIGSGMSGNWSTIIFEWRVYGSTGAWSNYSISNPQTILTVVNLTHSTQYEFRCRSYLSSVGLYSVNYTYGYPTTLVSLRPDNWTWTTSIYTGAPLTINNGLIYVIPASEWNSFTAKINAFRTYKGLTAYSFTTVSRGSRFLESFNEAVNALSDLSQYFASGYTIPTVKTSTNKIYANYFTSMRDALNSIG
jgi:hypothetical protein